MFLRFLSDGGTGLVALGAPVGSRNRGFSLSFSGLVGYGCPKHTMFLYNFNRTWLFHSVVPSKLCCDVSWSFFESACDSLGLCWVTLDAFVAPGLPCGPPVGRSGTTVLRFQHFLLFIILLIFMNS